MMIEFQIQVENGSITVKQRIGCGGSAGAAPAPPVTVATTELGATYAEDLIPGESTIAGDPPDDDTEQTVDTPKTTTSGPPEAGGGTVLIFAPVLICGAPDHHHHQQQQQEE